MRIAVAGSRDWTDRIRLFRALNVMRMRAADKRQPFSVGFGDCPTGTDLFVWDWCKHWGLHYRRFEIPKDRNGRWIGGRAAGPLRNRRMIDQFMPDYVIACLLNVHLDQSRGTRDCVAYAESLEIPVWKLYEPKESKP